jgi:hypothetical protein
LAVTCSQDQVFTVVLSETTEVRGAVHPRELPRRTERPGVLALAGDDGEAEAAG